MCLKHEIKPMPKGLDVFFKKDQSPNGIADKEKIRQVLINLRITL